MKQKAILHAKANKLLEQYGRLSYSLEEIKEQMQLIRNQLMGLDEALKLLPLELVEDKVTKSE